MIQYQDNKITSKLKSASNHFLFTKKGAPKKANENPETVLVIIISLKNWTTVYITMSDLVNNETVAKISQRFADPSNTSFVSHITKQKAKPPRIPKPDKNPLSSLPQNMPISSTP